MDAATAARKADDFIMGLCEPEKMPAAKAVDFLNQVIERCKSAIEALEEENGDLE